MVGRATQCESFLVCLALDPVSAWYKSVFMIWLWTLSVFMISFFVPLTLILVCSLRIVSELRRRYLDHYGNIKRW